MLSVEVRKSAVEPKPQISAGMDDISSSVEAVVQDSDLPGISLTITLITITAFLHVFTLTSSGLYRTHTQSFNGLFSGQPG